MEEEEEEENAVENNGLKVCWESLPTKPDFWLGLKGRMLLLLDKHTDGLLLHRIKPMFVSLAGSIVR